MDRTKDELAGVVDLFGGLTRDELARALTELAFRRGADVDESAVDRLIEEAREDYYLVGVETDEYAAADDRELLVPGPVAFPTVPDDGEDLPHILDVERRRVPREDRAAAFRARLAAEIGTDPDESRVEYLLDVTYDAETWAPVEADDLRERLQSHLDS
ncbi:DUF7109 family protein [Halospeciosus flavus]|uniref:Uncharacterized protein n=1 Tax=Halospeciosus flavus TaxID=3032283 RepID=A0ABD5Z686_9EURY|nr:hypothetical protein [Halospeciosus flavus]